MTTTTRTITTTMRAARLHEVAGPFQVDEVPVPEPVGSDVRVRVHTCGVVPNLKNVVTYYAGVLAIPPLPAIYGLDAAGVIDAVGPEVTELSIGQRVYVNPVRTCGSCRACRAGKPLECPAFVFAGYFGMGPAADAVFRRYPYGGFAEYTVAPATAIVPLPDAVSFEDAAHFGYLGTSYGALRRGQAGPDTTVLVNGATGTLGVGAVVLALALGVPRILAVGRNRAVLDRLAALAPLRIRTHSIDDGPIEEWTRQQTDGEGANLVIDTLGPGTPTSVLVDSLRSVATRGRIVTIGGVWEPFEFDPAIVARTHASYTGNLWFTTAQGEEMAALAGAGVLDLSVYEHDRYPLDRVNEAVEASLSRALGGFTSVVVTI